MNINKIYIVVTYDDFNGINIEFFVDKDKAEAHKKEFLSISRNFYSVLEHEITVYQDDTWKAIMERGCNHLSHKYNREHWKAWCLQQEKGGEHKMKCETGLSFGQAIEAMKAGKRCSRVGWKNYQYIELATDISYKDAHGDVVDTNGHYAIAFVDMCGLYIGWSPSQSDMFAWDWQIVGE